MDSIRKNIDIRRDVFRELKKLAADADKDLKNYIQDLLVDHVRKNRPRN